MSTPTQVTEADARRERITWEAVAQRASDLAKSLEEAEAELKAYRDAVDAQPWASDAPIRVLLDQITSELLATRNLLIADTEVQAELATERARLDWLTMNTHVEPEEYRGGSFSEGGTLWYSWRFSAPRHAGDHASAAIDAAMKADSP